MAERVYRKKSVGAQSPTAFGGAPFTQGGLGASTTAPPTVSMQGAEQSGQRVYRKKATAVTPQATQRDDETGYRDALAATKKREELLGVDTEKLASDIQFTEGLIDLINEYRDWESKDPKYHYNEAGLGAAEVGGNLYGLEQRMAYYGISPEDKKSLEEKLAAAKEQYGNAKDAQVLDAVGKAQSDPDYVHHVNTGAAMKKSTFDNYDKIAGEMTQEQKQNYNYLLSKYGKEDADRYFKMVQSEIQSNRATDFYKKHLEDTWYEGLFSVVQGLDQASTGLQSAFGNKHTDDRLFDPQMVGAMVRENLGENSTPLWYNFKEGKWEDKAFGSTLGQIAYDFGSTTANMVPAIGLGAASNLVIPGAGAYVTPALLGISSGGNAYKEALSQGYTEQQARTYGVLVGSSEALLGKVLGSIGPAGKSLTGSAIQGATSGIKNAGARFALQLGGEMLSEAAEEGLQEILTPFFENIALDADNTWEDIDWEQATYSALMGALSAGLFEGAVTPLSSVAKQSAQQNAQYRTLGRQFINGENGVNIDAAIAIGLDNAKGTDAYKAAQKIQQQVKAGKTVSPYTVGRMVAQSQTEQAQTARNIERTVLSTAKEWNIPTDAAETVSAAAVSLGQKVEFVSPEGMHNRYMAGEYDSATDTVRLNAAERNVEKLIGAVLAHEMVHTAEGTDQLQKLAQIAERMENHKNGAGAWEKLQADVKSKYAAADKQLSDPEVKKEALAHWIAENLFQNKAFAKAVADGDANVGNAFFYMIDRVRRAMGAKKASAGNLAMLERLFMQALDNRTLGPREGDVQYSIRQTSKMSYAKQLEQIEKGTLNGSNSLYVGGPSVQLQKAGFSDKPFVMNQGDYRKSRRTAGKNKHYSSHAVSYSFFRQMPQHLAEAPMLIDNGGKVTVVTAEPMNDTKGKKSYIIVGVLLDQSMESESIHQVKSVYPLDDFVEQIKKAADDGRLVAINENKTKQMLATIGVQPSEVSRIVGLAKNTLSQNATDVNTQSMQEGAGISAQGALLSPESMEVVRNGTWREARMVQNAEGVTPSADGYTSSVTADAVPPSPQGEGFEAVQVDEAAVLETAIRSQPRSVVDVSDTIKVTRNGERHYDVDAALDRLDAELGTDELLKQMYNAAQLNRPTGMVEIDGQRVDAGAYMDAYAQRLPDDVAALEQTVRRLEKERAAEVARMHQEGTLQEHTFGGLKIDLQLFAAKRKWDLLQLDAGENGKKVRQFYEKRLRGTDANHSDELVELLAGRTETYNPIANEKTLSRAKDKLRDTKYQEKLLKRIGRYDSKDLFNAQEVAAATVLINDAINEGEFGVAADLITGLSRKGTEAGRAVQAFSMMARMTPEGTLRAAVRTLQADADYVVGEGANEGLNVLADDLVKAIAQAEEEGLSSEEIAERIRTPREEDLRGVEGAAPYGADSEVSAEGAAAWDGTVGNGNPSMEGATREQVVDALVDDLAKTEGNYLSKERIGEIVEKAVNDASNIPEQLKRYVLKKIRKNDGGLAQRIYEVYQKGHLSNVTLRRAMEAALELPTLSDADVEWIANKATEIQSLEKDPVKQADAMDELYDYLGAKLSVKVLDRLQAWRKFGMLANVKTHLRNIFSNIAYAGIRKADDAVAMVLERIFVRDRSQWGAALGWSHTEHGKNLLPALQKQAELAVLEMQKRGAKYEQGTGQLKQKRKFFGESRVGEKLNDANRWNSDMLEAEDVWFFRPAYIDALGQVMTARGVTEITPELHELAMQRALEATFRADNAISEVISSLKRFQNATTAGKRLFGHGVDVVIPFHKTPANIATQTIMHSPVGIAKGAVDLYNAVRGKGSKQAADAINEMAKGLTGTALLIIGLLLGKAGLFNVGFGKTEKERAADELAGLQEGAFVIGGVSVSLDWLQPAASPLVVGASIGERLTEGGLGLGGVFGAVMDGTDSLFEMTMLQSLYDILGGYDAGASATALSVVENVVSQSVPTLIGQAARAIDPVQRKTTGDTDAETLLNQVLAKIPGLTYLLDPELDVWGNEVYRTGKPGAGTTVLNALQQILIPANTKVGTGKDDPISEEILRLYEDQGSKVIPTAVSRDEAKEAGEDYVDINRLLGGVNRLAVEEFVDNQKAYDVQVETGELTEKGNPRTKKVTKYYRDMTDDERRNVLGRIYTNSKAGVIGESDHKTEEQLTESERYVRDLLRRVRNGGGGTAATAAAEPKTDNNTYYSDLLRRMKNGN